jgi:hypothetical protein
MVAYDETGSRMPGDPPKGKNVEVRAMGLPGDRPGEAAGLLARCFHNNPNFVDLFPDQRDRSRALTRVFAAGLRDALGFGYVYVATREVESSTGGELVGVVAWLPPGVFLLSPGRQLRALPGMAGLLVAAPRSALRLLRYTAGITRRHPAQPYWYLEVVGVDPTVGAEMP